MPPDDLFKIINDIKPDPKHLSEVCALVEDIDVLLMTATEIELRGIMGLLERPKDATQIIETVTEGKTSPFYIGKYGQYIVAVGMSAPAKSHQGSLKAFDIVQDIMETVKPHFVIAVGICYGMDQKLKFGDIVVSDFVADFTTLRHTHLPDGNKIIQLRSSQPPAGYKLVRQFGNSAGFKMQYHKNKLVKVHCGPIIARSDLVDDNEYKEDLKNLRSDALAGEMEGAGVMFAAANVTYDARIEAIIIKAVADWGDGRKNECGDWKPFASHAAAQYVHYILNKSLGVFQVKEHVATQN